MTLAFRAGASLLFVLLAPVLLLHGLANAQMPFGPARDWSGYWLALLSMAHLEVEQVGNGVSLAVSDEGAELAREAFAKEPLATNALFVLGVEQRQQGRAERMNAVFAGANALDKRNLNIGALQLEQAALSRDVQGAFDVIDRLSSIYPAMQKTFVRPLIDSLRDDGVAEQVSAELAREPVWAQSFWLSVPPDPEIVARMYAMRQSVSQGTSANSDAVMLSRLVQTELYDSAFELWSQTARDRGDRFGFVANAENPPFGWQVVSRGNRAMAPREGGAFEAYVQNDTSGELARQILRLEPGRYSFSADIVPRSDAEHIEASLQCVDEDAPRGSPQQLDTPATWTISGGCRFYWLILSGNAWNMRQPLQASIEGMRFTQE